VQGTNLLNVVLMSTLVTLTLINRCVVLSFVAGAFCM